MKHNLRVRVHIQIQIYSNFSNTPNLTILGSHSQIARITWADWWLLLWTRPTLRSAPKTPRLPTAFPPLRPSNYRWCLHSFHYKEIFLCNQDFIKMRKIKIEKVLLALHMACFYSWPLWALEFVTLKEEKRSYNRITLEMVTWQATGQGGDTNSWINFDIGEMVRADHIPNHFLIYCTQKRWKIQNYGLSRHWHIYDL